MAALKACLDATGQSPGHHLWVVPVSFRPLYTVGLSRALTVVIRRADPSAPAGALDVRKCASSLAFFQCSDVYAVRKAGKWASSSAFVTRCLLHRLRDLPCGAMVSLHGGVLGQL